MIEQRPLAWTLSGFADEISPDLDTQLEVLASLGIHHLELRSIGGVNVLDLTDEQVESAGRHMADAGIRVSAIGSPLGKSELAEPFERTERRLTRALDLAIRLGAHYVRVFSFYPGDERPEPAFAEAASRLRLMAAEAQRRGVVLSHENERGILGERAEGCVRLLQEVNSPALRATFDPANFVQAGELPFPDAFQALEGWIAYVHVKDARFETGEVVPAGEGDARFPDLLRALANDRFEGFLSLEPHLANSQPGGGPDAFRRAASALRGLVEQIEGVRLV